MIALNDLGRHNAPLRDKLDAAIARVQDRGWYILGPEVEAFEREFAAWCGAGECVAVGNGTDALELALRSLAIGPGDEVATTANAGMYATTAIRAAGATPVYVDVDGATLLMDPAALRASLTLRMRAVIATHLYGRLADVGALGAIARQHGVPLIEDCAQAHGAASGDRKAGTFGALGCFSFYPTKNLGALGDAGAVVTGDRELAAKLRALRTYGWGEKYRCRMTGGMNSRMDELQAAVLRVKLPHVDGWNRRRREIAAGYASAIAHPDIVLPSVAADARDVVHLYVVRTDRRESLRTHLAAAGVATDVHYPVPDHLQPGPERPQPGADHPQRDPDDLRSDGREVRAPLLPHTERACAEVVTLPCYPELTDAEIAEVAAACNRWQPVTPS